MTDPVSVVIPVHDGGRWLSAAIESALTQEGAPHEVIVVNDGSTDGTGDVMRRYAGRIRAVHQEKSGAAAARNRGVLEARGRFLTFLDADDLWAPGKSIRQLAELERRGPACMVFGQARQFREAPASPLGEASPLPSRPEPVLPAVCAGTLLIERERFLSVGPFDPSLPVGEFLAWYGRAVDAGLAAHLLPDVLLLRRIHDHNQGVLQAESYAPTYLRILREMRERRRRVPA